MPKGIKGFQKGHKFSRGGKRANGGDHSRWWKEQAARIIRKAEGLKLLEDAIEGKPVDVFITQQGEEIPIQAKFKDRKDAFFELAEHAFGKSTQSVDLQGNMSFNLVEAIKEARKERGLDPEK